MFIFGQPNIKKLSRKADVKGLIRSLGYPKDEKVRLAAIDAINEIKGMLKHSPESKEADPGQMLFNAVIQTALHDKSENVRMAAVSSLRQWNSPSHPPKEAIETLARAISDTSDKVRRSAAQALGWEKAAGTLKDLLKESSGVVRLSVIEGLGCAGAVEPLTGLLGDSSEEVRLAAVRALGEAGWRGAEPLVSAMDDSSPVVLNAILASLTKIGALSLAPLIRALIEQRAALAQPQLAAFFRTIKLEPEPWNSGKSEIIPDGFLEVGRNVMVLINRALFIPGISRQYRSKMIDSLKSPRRAGRIPIDVLHDLTLLQDGVYVEVTHIPGEASDSPDAMYASPDRDEEKKFVLDCAEVRDLARQELARRESNQQ